MLGGILEARLQRRPVATGGGSGKGLGAHPAAREGDQSLRRGAEEGGAGHPHGEAVALRMAAREALDERSGGRRPLEAHLHPPGGDDLLRFASGDALGDALDPGQEALGRLLDHSPGGVALVGGAGAAEATDQPLVLVHHPAGGRAGGQAELQRGSLPVDAIGPSGQHEACVPESGELPWIPGSARGAAGGEGEATDEARLARLRGRVDRVAQLGEEALRRSPSVDEARLAADLDDLGDAETGQRDAPGGCEEDRIARLVPEGDHVVGDRRRHRDHQRLARIALGERAVEEGAGTPGRGGRLLMEGLSHGTLAT